MRDSSRDATFFISTDEKETHFVNFPEEEAGNKKNTMIYQADDFEVKRCPVKRKKAGILNADSSRDDMSGSLAK